MLTWSHKRHKRRPKAVRQGSTHRQNHSRTHPSTGSVHPVGCQATLPPPNVSRGLGFQDSQTCSWKPLGGLGPVAQPLQAPSREPVLQRERCAPVTCSSLAPKALSLLPAWLPLMLTLTLLYLQKMPCGEKVEVRDPAEGG